jgi:DNA-binding response OmpR family regulator
MKKILISDQDNSSIAYYLGVIRGHTKIIALNADDTVNQFQDYKPEVVILGSRLNNGNGFDVAKKIRSLSSDVKIVMISGDTTVKNKALESGCNHFFLKPITKEAILALID